MAIANTLRSLLKSLWLLPPLLLIALSQLYCTSLVASAVYDRADYILLSRIDSFFDLNGDQEERLEEQLEHFHTWHRNQELPRYRRLLADVKRGMKQGYSRQEALLYFKEVGSFRNAILKWLHPRTEAFLADIGPQQISYLAQKLEDSNEELEEYAALSATERQESRTEKALETLERWMGSLTAEQEQLFRKMSLRLPDFDRARLRMQKERQKQFILALQNRKKEPQKLRQLLSRWMLDPEGSMPAYYRRAIGAWRSATIEIMLAADQLASKEQRERYVEELDEWIAILDSMIASGKQLR